ncbi:MAG: glutamine synthetase family protein [Candidatus Aureabacteria bacterium]|nr:glutamine synthetase family protein [Candidatus Auribacterota bacterium]
MARTKEEVVKLADKLNVRFVRLCFPDVLGRLKGFAITRPELEEALESGMGFDGSSIEGFARIEESDMIALPDPDTFCVLPWRPQEGGAEARMFCDILQPDGSPYVGDPRYVLKRAMKRAADKGYTYMVGPELEFFYLQDDKSLKVLDSAGYFDMVPIDLGTDLRRETIQILECMGIPVEYDHHEVAPSQHEIDLRYTDVLTMADNAMTYRLVVKDVAKKHGVYATFMPKPIEGQNGSGMHVHQSLCNKDGRNAFFDKNDPYHLSQVAKSFIAGILHHAKEICIITNQWVNSYKRLVPGYEAPVYISWAQRNRSTMIRVPMYKPGKEKATRIEFRAPDPACNPYLAFAVMLAAGLEGLENDYPLAPPVEEDIFEFSPQKRADVGIETLPGSLYAAIVEAEKSELLRKTLGDHIHTKIIENKTIEWDNYRIHVSQYEIDKYLSIL